MLPFFRQHRTIALTTGALLTGGFATTIAIRESVSVVEYAADTRKDIEGGRVCAWAVQNILRTVRLLPCCLFHHANMSV